MCKTFRLSVISLLAAAASIQALPTNPHEHNLNARAAADTTDFPHLPFTSASWTGERRISTVHPNGWTTAEVTSFLDRASARATALRVGADDWATVEGNNFTYSEPTNTKTKFALLSPSDIQTPRPLVWKDVSIGIELYRNQTAAETQRNPTSAHLMQYFAYFVGAEQYLARGFFGDASETAGLVDGPQTS